MRICCATWDVEGLEPGLVSRTDMLKWLYQSARYQQSINPELDNIPRCDIDIYAVGFQQIIPMDYSVKVPVPKIMINGANNWDVTRMSIRDKVLYAWANKLVSTINSIKRYPNYQLYGAYMLNGTAMFVIVRDELITNGNIRNGRASTLRADAAPTDMELFLLPDNKSPGAVGLRIECGGSSMAFVCAHLSDGEGIHACGRRNAQYEKISRELFRDQGLSLNSHEYVFWFGDLNYRICPPTTGPITPSEVWDMEQRGELEALLEVDELQLQRRAGVAFQGFQEGKPTFPPSMPGRQLGVMPGTTFQQPQVVEKYDKYPYWADRILWRRKDMSPSALLQNIQLGNDEETVIPDFNQGTLISYAMADVRVSDHRPIVAVIDVDVQDPSLGCFVAQPPRFQPQIQPRFQPQQRVWQPQPQPLAFQPQPQQQPQPLVFQPQPQQQPQPLVFRPQPQQQPQPLVFQPQPQQQQQSLVFQPQPQQQPQSLILQPQQPPQVVIQGRASSPGIPLQSLLQLETAKPAVTVVTQPEQPKSIILTQQQNPVTYNPVQQPVSNILSYPPNVTQSSWNLLGN